MFNFDKPHLIWSRVAFSAGFDLRLQFIEGLPKSLKFGLFFLCELSCLRINLPVAVFGDRLTSLSKQYDFGMVFFAAIGEVLLIVVDGRSDSDAWLTPVLSLSLMLFACGNALRGRKMVSRLRSFNDRFDSWHVSYLTHFDGLNKLKKCII